MKFWSKILLAATALAFSNLDGDDELKEFDDDAFLSSKVAPDESSGLVGWSLFSSEDGDDRYIINFNNVSIIEYLRFVSRISNLNFQFEESELDFTVTLMSEEPLRIQDIVSALIQTLRARGFSVLEENKNLFITRSREVNQIPEIVSGKNPDTENIPIVTRIFRIKNANLNSIAGIIKPMMSNGAMVDISNETRQLIVTDVTTNVNKVATLLESLDTPHSPFEIESYRVRHMSAEMLIVMAQEILKPFADDNELILVPQLQTNTIFIVSTPTLIERTMEVMEDLDASPKEIKGPIGDQVYLYPIENKSPDELLAALKEIANELEGTGAQSVKLVNALENAKWVKDSNSLLFVTDTETQKKIEAIMKTLDTLSESRNYYIYKVQKSGKDQLENSLEQLAKSLKRNPMDRELVDAIHSLRYIKETDSFIFTGSDTALKKLQEILPSLDISVSEYAPSSHYWLYTPKYLSGRELEKAIEDLEDSLSDSGLSDEALLSAIESMKWVPSTNTLLFTGDPNSLSHIESIIKLIDVPSGSPSKIFIYNPQYISNEQIEEALDELADKLDHKNITDRNLAAAIDSMTWIGESQTFLFKADPGSIDKVEEILKEIDNPKEALSIASAYYLYSLQYARGNDVIDHLENIAKNLPDRDPNQKAIINAIDDATFLQDTNAILLTGHQKAIEEVKALIAQFDVKGATPAPFEKTSFYIYKPTHLTISELQEALSATAQDLKKSGLIDPSLLQSIETMQAVEMTGSLVFTGTKESLEKTKEIIDSIDTVKVGEDSLGEFAKHTFFIYKVRYLSLDELLKLLSNVIKNLERTSSAENKALIKALKTAKPIAETNSVLFTGPPSVLEKVAALLKQIDMPGGMDQVREAGSYVIYKPVSVSGPELIDMMKDFEQHLAQSGVQEPSLFETIHNLKYIERTGYILISGPTEGVDKTQELLKKFDSPGAGGITSLSGMETSFLVYKLEYHTGKQIQETLKKIGIDLSASSPGTNPNLLSAINSLQWIEITNSLLASGTPDVLTQLKELIQNVDVPLRQVFLEMLIIRTTISNNQQFGLQWGGKVQYLNRFAGGISNFPSPSTQTGAINTALAPALQAVNATRTPLATDIPNPSISANGSETAFPGGFDLGVIGDIILHKGKSFISLASLVNALQSDNDSVIVMNPKIIAQDHQQSTIFVGQNIPFTGSNVTTTGVGASQLQSNIEYRDVGTNLSVTPILGTGDMITLDITNEISEQVKNSTSFGDSLSGLQTARTSLSARVHIPNKHFVALSGMIQDSKSHFKSGIPCLGGLPVIGLIFSENDRFNARDNIIFFIRPVIIDSIEQYDEITHTQECLYKEQASKQLLKEIIDDAIDWVDPNCY